MRASKKRRDKGIAEFSTNRKNVTAALFIAMFLASIEGVIVSLALPSIAKDLGMDHLMSWSVSIYFLFMVIGAPIFGFIADFYGRKAAFLSGAGLFMLGSALSGISTSMLQFIGFRAIQGAGAGALIPLTYTIIGDLYAYEERAKLLGWLTTIWGISGIVAPFSGGILIDYASWRWIFFFCLPFGFVSMLIFYQDYREKAGLATKHVNVVAILMFALGMAAFLLGISLLGEGYEWNEPALIGLFALSAVLLSLFFVRQRKSAFPLLPTRLFSIRLILFVNLTGFILNVIKVVYQFHLPLWFQEVLSKGATFAGLMLFPLSIAWPLASLAAGNLVGKVNAKSMTLTGALLIVAGSIGLACVQNSTPMWLYLVDISLFGLGIGLVTPLLTLLIQSSVDFAQRGTAIAANNFMRNMGQCIGIAVFGLILNMHATYAEGLKVVFLGMVPLACIALIMVIALPRRT
ncbi:MFS transporter [Paenibacillus sp.]|uniref:MFS transporter n=1 Tax=Paenibacillus sp. TaxID=58172 RepID=UPI002D3CC9A7|nr:MFS transporter [Paenibacillus sp.]HZG84053.1 MFS transporter [Paenibacillus sp.]